MLHTCVSHWILVVFFILDVFSIHRLCTSSTSFKSLIQELKIPKQMIPSSLVRAFFFT